MLCKETLKSMQVPQTDSCLNEVIGVTKKLLVLFVQMAMRLGWTIAFSRLKKKEETLGIQVNDGENRQYYLPIKHFESIGNLEEILNSIFPMEKFSVLFHSDDDLWSQTQPSEVLGIPMAVHRPEKTKAISLAASYREEDVERKIKEDSKAILRSMFREEEFEGQLKMRLITDEVVEDFMVGCSDKREVEGKAVVRMCERKILGDIRYKVESPVENYIRRDKCLQELRDRLLTSPRFRRRRVVVCGSVGVGKSELLRAFVATHGNEFQNIVWIESKEAQKARELFAELAFERIGILRNGTDGKEKSFETVVSDVYRFFRGKKALFVFDGAEEPASTFLPKSVFECNPYVVITSRLSAWEVDNVMHLGPFEEKEAEQYIPANRFGSILLKCLDFNPFLLAKLKANEMHAKDSQFELPLLEILPDKSCGDSSLKLHFCEDDVTRLKSTLNVLTESACSFLKELVSLKSSGEISSILSREENEEMLRAILHLKENSLLEVSNGKLILPKAVRSILFFHKW
ncbi:hypothetical protein J437_LFUL012787 [Ladona fulva]|uniref:Uncharacterized protein n=1 Tax=Ladona fulva TaxID=123851 RepID=A0A8K0KH32_LADFU|nr:hypothetical protein J437_LFUL012787 [Ladona fulva]